MHNKIILAVARKCGLDARQTEATIRLLDDGATVPFISRYRKELTGSLDEVAIRNIESRLKAERELQTRREFVSNAIADAGALSPLLAEQIENADSLTEIEDIYAPYKPKKRTRATLAREKGLEPLARIIMSGNCNDCHSAAARFVGKEGISDSNKAISGASDIIAEWVSESTRMRNITRNAYQRHARISAIAAKDKAPELAASPYASYDGFSQSIRRISSHQYLALRRAENEGLLRVKYEFGSKTDELDEALRRAFIPRHANSQCAEIITSAVCDASHRLLRPSVENEISAGLKEQADSVAIDIFATNLRQLLLASPLKGRRVLAIDPGYRTGCKVVALDHQGNLLDDKVIYPTPPKSDIAGAGKILNSLIARHKLDAIALGNGTASRETEKFLKDSQILPSNAIYVVSENGASVYSASEIARQEFPDKDVTVRGAVSIGRRLIDPLAELVKIDPKSIGVGQYQHDVDQNSLKDALDFTVMSCVNSVGIDVNTASRQLLSYVSGIGPALAKNIVEYRKTNGDFKSRNELRKVPRLGDKAYELAAGFLRIPGSAQTLDNTGIHPESYRLVSEMARSIGADVSQLPANGNLLDKIDVAALAERGIGGLQTMTDIISELRKPGRDPRVDGDTEAFQPSVESFEQLSVGSVVTGLVNNITAFGAFVDLGIKENGLLHISQLSRRRVSAVSDVLKLGQRIEVKIIEIDPIRRRISLSLIL